MIRHINFSRRTLIYLSVAVVMLVVGVFVARSTLTSARAVTVSPVPALITVNTAIGITFGPAPDGASPALSGAQAWSQYAELQGWSTAIPSDVTVQLGLVTVPVGPASAPDTGSLIKVNNTAYMAYNELAYGYSSPAACPQGDSLAERSLPPTPSPSPTSSCIDWSFVDANTGKQIVETWQTVS
jgi:hypothetical protein